MKSRGWLRALSFLLLTVVIAAPAAVAQNPAGQGQGRGMGGRQMQMLMQGITLTADQQTRVDSLNTAFMEQMRAMGRPEPGDEKAMTERREIMTKHQQAVRALLTKEQQAVFDKNVEAMKARMSQRSGPGR
ncbi:MAG: hypothetical protein AB7I33_05750 [Gemmatimonadales bacterium]